MSDTPLTDAEQAKDDRDLDTWIDFARELERRTQLQPIETAPRDGTWILCFGPSGHTTTPLRAEVGHYVLGYRPLNPWQTHANNAFTDGGPEPTHWVPLPTL